MGDTRVVSVSLRVRDVAATATYYRDAFGVSVDAAAANVSTRVEFVPAGDLSSGECELRLLTADLEAAHLRAVAAGRGRRSRRSARTPHGCVPGS